MRFLHGAQGLLGAMTRVCVPKGINGERLGEDSMKKNCVCWIRHLYCHPLPSLAVAAAAAARRAATAPASCVIACTSVPSTTPHNNSNASSSSSASSPSTSGVRHVNPRERCIRWHTSVIHAKDPQDIPVETFQPEFVLVWSWE